MRRITIIEPVSRCAVWSRRLALLALATTALALFLTRERIVDLDAGMAAILAGLILAVMALLLALGAFARIWSLGRRGFGSAIVGFMLALLLLALPAYIAGLRLYAPQPRDVSTDPNAPPAFDDPQDALPQRTGMLDRIVPQAPITESWRARAMVRPLYLDVPLPEAEDLARRAAQARGLRLHDPLAPTPEQRTEAEAALSRSADDPPPIPPSRPQGPMDVPGDAQDAISATIAPNDGTNNQDPVSLEAQSETPFLQLPLRLSVRITPVGDRVRIDARATAPQGNYDIGANSALLRGYLDEIAFLANPR